jgi:A/G-specific adenine glycosylase
VEALANATEDEVLREWQGLGYYSRARNLHTAAKQVLVRGGFPTTIEGIKALKGIGDYTAAAIGSIAFDLPAAVVDGNVYRVLARHYGIATPINTTEGKKEFTALAQSLLPTSQASAFNQAMMDFGAIQCTPTKPLCLQCPLQDSCVALREGRISELPVKQRTLKVKERHLTYVYIRCNGYTALHRRPAGDIWQGLYECVPHSDLQVGELWLTEKVPCGAIQLRQNVKHVLTHRILYADFWLWEVDERPQLPDGYFWIKEEEIGNYGVPRLIEILLETLNT